MKIITIPDPRLRKFSEDVPIPMIDKDIAIAELMIKYIEDSKDPRNGLRPGVGIAAVQLGFLRRMFYVSIPQMNGPDFKELLINPKKIGESVGFAALEHGEGCLSVPDDVQGLVHRKEKIIVRGYSFFEQKFVEYKLSGYEAIVFQHELEHLDGKLYIDKIDVNNPFMQKKGEVIV